MNTKTVWIVVLTIIVFLLGFLLGRVTSSSVYSIEKSTDTSESVSDTVSGNDSATDDSFDPPLTDGQRKLLSSVGINPDEFTITSAMAACAETKFGASRVEEFKNGATPSFTESAGLLVCYKQ